MRSLNAAESQFAGDDGAADPAVLAALAAYAAGQGSEHAALNALASSRLLVPVVAVLTEEASGDTEAAVGTEAAEGIEAAERSETEGAGDGRGSGLRREKSTEMALPTLIGQDGRAAVLAFTSLDALTRWRPDARPVAVPAARAWQAGAEEASAVVIDVAGPVPVTVEGSRLAALAAGRPAPLPHQDPDVLAALHAALGGEPLIVQASLTTPDQRAGWEYGPRPEDLPDLAARSGADLSALGVALPDPGRPGQDGAGPDARQDAARQNGAGPDARQDAARQDAASPDARQAGAGPDARQDSAGPDAARQDGVGQDGARQDGVGQDGARPDAARQDGASPDARQDGASQDGASQDGASQDGASQDAARQDSAATDGRTGASAAGTSSAGDKAAGRSAGAGGAARGGAGTGTTGDAGMAGSQKAAPPDTADLALQVTLADGCDPAAATAAVRRVAEALLTATGGRLRRGLEVSVAPARPVTRGSPRSWTT